ncbi:MKL/myocardin-like protein 2 isoform X6 [Heterocephalus glaber]|uniref:Phosphatase and actin regulator n=1 Tax=Heterocephalus glaber TaxID=10181 RepID=A0AAX6R406_HETGA|nr:MKL/myocardin-like protein 2 isoform X6 [Heterocephalus glaber]
MDHGGAPDTEDELGPLAHLAPSPQSEAVAHEFQELSLQSSQHLPSLNERKNGSVVFGESGLQLPLLTQSVSMVLQLRLQQRRTREQLVDQGIMPPLKSPAAFHEQIKSLERARTENFLKHKIRSRPDRSELVRMHILEETFAEPSLQATQMKLKRARLADDLNEKIAQRPGPMELVEKNILPVDSSVKEAIIGVGKEDYPHTQGDFSFDEDSSDALSPDQPASQESQGSVASPSEPKVSEAPSPVTTNTPAQFTSVSPAVPEFLKTPPNVDQLPTRSTAPVLPTNTVSSAKPSPTLVKQSHPKNPNDKHRSKKCKDPKPRVKKLKYHQYIPPDQKGEKNEPQMDSNYARLLQQQQLFLQLQILSQQQQHYNYQAILPAPTKNDKNNNSGNSSLNNTMPNTPRQNTSAPVRKPGPLPSSLDDLKTPPQAGIQTQPQIATATPVPAAALPSGLAPTAPQKQDAFPQHVVSQPQQVRKVFTSSAPNPVLPYPRQSAPAVQQPFVAKTSNSVLQSRTTPLPSLQNGTNTSSKPSSSPPPQQFVVQHSLFGTSVTKTKDPPRYEEAIKQTRSAQSSLPEISNAHSQQMDDLFDILIKSGEISLPIKEEPSPISKMRPVTASITTMPVNTVVSRPPPQVQMAPPVSLEPMSSLSASLENQLEAFLDGTLPSANEIAPLQSSSEDREPFSLIEDLQNDLLSHSSMLDHSHSPMETSEAQFAAGTPCLSLDLSDSNLDNMEWLDITMPNTSSGLTPLSATAPSMFSADFLDPQDLPLPWD